LPDFEIILRPRHGTRHGTTIIKVISDRLKVWLRDRREARRPSEGRGVGEQRVCEPQNIYIKKRRVVWEGRKGAIMEEIGEIKHHQDHHLRLSKGWK
jgi:hypothetical protein